MLHLLWFVGRPAHGLKRRSIQKLSDMTTNWGRWKNVCYFSRGSTTVSPNQSPDFLVFKSPNDNVRCKLKGQTSHHFAINKGLSPTNDKFNSSLNDLSIFQRDDSGTTLMYVPCVTVLKPCKCGAKQTLKYVSSIFPLACPYVASHVHSVNNLKLSDYIFQGTFKG